VEERIQNLGPRSRSWLAEVGIATLSDLRECVLPVPNFRAYSA
jgi:hypothetical protein